ncbi:hypothetical protein D3C78_703700 [compost metagenome]
MRGKYWYDFELKDEHRPFKEISDDNRKEAAKSSGAQLLDAFVYHNYDIAEMPGSVRLGKQVVSWGESTFIPNSINSINPVDVSAFRRPGAEVKEALVPVNMFYLSQSLTDSLSAEAFYQLEWDQTVLDNCGTFFGGDVVPDGCDQNNANNAAPGFGALMQRFEPIAAANGQGFLATDEGVILPRGGDRDARDNGQWGLAMRWMTDSVEYGAYAMNYHSRNPYYSSQTAGADTLASLSAILPAVGQACAGVPGCGSVVQGMALSTVLGNANYFIEYPEDIRLYGLSFATTLPSGTAWSGDLSYRPNMPLQISTPRRFFRGAQPHRADQLADTDPAWPGQPWLPAQGNDPAADHLRALLRARAGYRPHHRGRRTGRDPSGRPGPHQRNALRPLPRVRPVEPEQQPRLLHRQLLGLPRTQRVRVQRRVRRGQPQTEPGLGT